MKIGRHVDAQKHVGTHAFRCKRDSHTSFLLPRDILCGAAMPWNVSLSHTQIPKTTYILAMASEGSTSHQSLLSSVPPRCHHPITSSRSHESTNQHRLGAVQILPCSCWQKISCRGGKMSQREPHKHFVLYCIFCLKPTENYVLQRSLMETLREDLAGLLLTKEKNLSYSIFLLTNVL